MIFFLLEVIVVSILASLFATWIKLVPRYPKRKYVFLQQLTNAVLMTIPLTFFGLFEIYPSWFLLFLIIVFVLWLSVNITNRIVRRREDFPTESIKD